MKLITDVLREIRRGALIEEATYALADVVRAVDETGRDGTVTINLKIRASKHRGPEKTILAEVKAKKPRAEIAAAIFFSDDDGDLHRVDPNQEEIKFSEVKTEPPKAQASA